jgi:MFS family permease
VLLDDPLDDRRRRGVSDGTVSPTLGGAAADANAVVPRWWPARVYYGWAIVATLGVTTAASYGVLLYAFAVFITPMGAELGWSKARITGAFSAAQLLAGVTAIPLGRWVDRHGCRGVMTAGSVLASLMLVAWSRVHSIGAFYVVWALLGVASAAVLYEPAFAVVATWFRRDRGRALTLLTFIGGFASVVFVPLTTYLVERHGWRQALVWLAGIYAALTIAPHFVVPRRRPGDLGLEPDGRARAATHDLSPNTREQALQELREHSVSAPDAIRSRAFRWLTVAFALSALTSTAITVHLVPLLRERGFAATFAGAAMGILGLMALPGRLIFTPLGGRWSRAGVTASIFGLSSLAFFTLMASHAALAVWVFVALFGAGFGAITPARAALVAEQFGAASFAEISGVLALVLSLMRAVGPVGASFVYESTHALPVGGYDAVLVVLTVMSLGAAAAVLAAGARRHHEHATDVSTVRRTEA